MAADIKTLVDKLNALSKKCLEESAAVCVQNTNFTVDIEHFLLKTLDHKDSDLSVILPYYNLTIAECKRALENSIAQFKRGNNKTPSLSMFLMMAFEEAWLTSSLTLKQQEIRTATILLAALKRTELRSSILENCAPLSRINVSKFEDDLEGILKGSPEKVSSPFVHQHADEGEEGSPPSTQALDRFTIDLTDQAKSGKIDPVYGRDREIFQMIDILTRRRQNNPILTGEAGVGKTAIVEGLAQRIVTGDVPPALENVKIKVLDLGLLEAGAGIKGEFENRLKSVIEEVSSSMTPIILFIDEAHNLIGSGKGGQGQGDAANLLKPALARGELRTIAATTWDEYKKYFEKDAALSRRFQVVKVDEPDSETAVQMLRGLTAKLEAHHNVLIIDEAIREAVYLSERYLSGRKLPDKAISVLDTACARVGLSQNATPEVIQEARRQLSSLETEEKLLLKEVKSGHEHTERLQTLKTQILQQKENLNKLTAAFEEEKSIVKSTLDVQKQVLEMDEGHPSFSVLQEQVKMLKEKLTNTQNEQNPLVPLCVTPQVVASVISQWTGIPMGKMMKDEIDTILNLSSRLSNRLIGQTHALETLAKHIVTYRANLDEPGKPVGVFLLVGPSGVGKTETALSLADTLYGGEKNLITINMSEYQESYTVSSLKGSPPGYVGHGKGGVLTEAVRRKPYSVILFDEVEKAHSDVMELFYQVFDKGVMEDSEGIEVSFKNALILMTSNLASEHIDSYFYDNKNNINIQELHQKIRPTLVDHFKPALLARMTVVPYLPLDDKNIEEISKLKLERISKRFFEHHNVTFTFDPDVLRTLVEKCNTPGTGARNIDQILNQNLLPMLSKEILERISSESPFRSVHVSICKNSGDFKCSFDQQENIFDRP